MAKGYTPKELVEWDKKYLWHPYTQMREYDPPFKNLIIERGEGNYLIDIYGNKYLDAVSSIWCNLFGHSERRIIEEIKRQADKICHSTLLGCGNVPSILLAKKLVEITPPHLTKVFYSEDGSEAVEIALKIAFQYYQLKDPEGNKKRTKFLSVKDGYHGDTFGAMSVGGSEIFHGLFKPLLFKGYHGNPPYCYRCRYGHNFRDTDERMEMGCSMDCLEDMLKLLEEAKDELFCIILEGGIMGSAGMIPYPDNYIEELARRSKEEGIVFILDEVATFGRLGRYLYSEREELKSISKPDIITIGKGITGGYLPLAVTMTTDEIYNQFLGDFEELRHFFHGHTYTGNQLLCTSALATLEILGEKDFFKKVNKKIEMFHRELDKLKELEHVGDVRKKGFMVGIELVKDKKTKEPYSYREKVAYRVAENLLKRGIYMRPILNTIILVPPLTITENEIEILCRNLYDAIRETLG
ncbi:adenosylmethionine--8-amino-7-oxononanoate transaminase [Methanofervidicoccus abyssi]|uniref:Adenosylmethionine-8-amino-7-oxononanoate aminotransferase n=1 Tax=Methanofervidicoccus abyssi TaxID=2082189 RepID=A0A401HQN3_9EURY|nr:adenosylmethionine--8-amino-7-oxononanoate transaminase [Methanofervidicoccus abyssi]GBF36525.1 adenosylmethionine---8-amino-7-oxononanoate aminotransferase [Methanofervidicoccus abyssi]